MLNVPGVAMATRDVDALTDVNRDPSTQRVIRKRMTLFAQDDSSCRHIAQDVNKIESSYHPTFYSYILLFKQLL